MQFGFNPFGEQFDTYNVSIDIEVDGNSQRQSIGAPKMFIIQQFLALVQQAANTKQCVYIKMSHDVEVRNEWTGKTKVMQSTLEFKNAAYLKWKGE